MGIKKNNETAHIGARIERTIFKYTFSSEKLNGIRKNMKYLFPEDKANEQIPHISEVLNNSEIKITRKTKDIWYLKCNYKNFEKSPKIKIRNFDSKKPTLLFHHGLGGIQEERHLMVVINDTMKEKFNLLTIRASDHDTFGSYVNNVLRSFMDIVTTTGASIMAAEEAIKYHRENSDQPIIFVGLSMGGIICSHHYYHYDTADLYFPIISYPNFGEIILNEKSKPFWADPNKKFNKSYYKSFLVTKQVKNKRDKNKIVPTIGKYDELIDFNKAYRFWKEYKPMVFNVGHYSIFFERETIRARIIRETEAIASRK